MITLDEKKAASQKHWLPFVRFGSIAVLGLLGAWFLYLAAFHSWASWGPPSPNPEWHASLSMRFLVLSALSILGFLCLIFGPMIRRRFTRNEKNA